MTILQKPNLPLTLWAIATIVKKLTSGQLENLADSVAIGAITLWAVMELFQGVNIFRRLLGLAVLTMTLRSLLKL